MTQVGFHLLESQSGVEAYLRLIGKCVQSLYKQGRKVYIHAKDEEQAHAVDEWLWTQELNEFVPHNIVGEAPISHRRYKLALPRLSKNLPKTNMIA